MIPRLLTGLVVVASVLFVACAPYPEHRPHKAKPGAKPNPAAVAPAEQAQRDAEQAALKKTEEANQNQVDPAAQAPALPGETPAAPPSNVTKPEPKRVDYPTAKRVPGREGIVLSPYNNKEVSVRNEDGTLIPSGKLVNDPTYQPSEKKYFRVP